MFTRCSYCQVAYEVTPEALAQGRGCLHCVACRHDFDALEWLTRELPEGEHAFKARPPMATPSPSSTDQAQASRWLELAFPDIAQDVGRPEPPGDPLSEALSVHSDLIEPALAPAPAEPPKPAQVFLPGAAMVSAFEVEARLALEAIPDPQTSVPATVDVPAHSPPQHTGTLAAPAAGVFGFIPTPATRAHHPGTSAHVESDHERERVPESWADAGSDYGSFDTQTSEALEISSVEAVSDAEDAFHPILDDQPAAAGPAPAFIPEPVARRSRLPALLPWLTIVLLSLLLAAQSLHAERERLAASAHWRPWIERLCHFTDCELPPWHDPAAMRLMARDVRPHPSVPGALLISASFRNEAPWAQPWPDLDLALADLDGNPIARRRFPPREYLGIGAQDELIQAGQTASVVLEVRDPGKQAVAFEFEFH